ncbi:MAG: hypothetical protein QXV20_06975, partial [Candidatus Hadarchaeales archaeon]
ASGTKQYEIRISSYPDFSFIYYSSITTLTNHSVTFTQSATYYWQVRAYDNVLNTSTWSTAYYIQYDTVVPEVVRNFYPDSQQTPLYFRSQGPIEADVDFFEYLSRLNELKYRITSKPDGTGTEIIPWTLIVSSPANVSLYTTNWSIPWDLLQEWATNYVHLYYSDRAGNYAYWYNCFDILKDTTPPTTPTLVSPVDGFTTNYTIINFSWSDSVDLRSGVSSYILHISTDPYFTVLSAEVTSYLSTVNYELSTGLYYWRVCAKDRSNPANFSLWSSTRCFRIDTIPPTINIGSSLIGGDTTWRRINDGIYDVDFYDDGDANLDKFKIRASTHPGGNPPYIFDWTDSGVNIYGQSSYTTDWQLLENLWELLPSGGRNYISIRIYDLAGNVSTYIDAFFIKKDTIPPQTPSLIAPVNGAATNLTNITFQWSSVNDLPYNGSGVKEYELQVSTDSSFSTIYYSSTTTLTSCTATLTQNQYYWRVNVRDNANNYSLSTTYYLLLIDTTPPVIEDLQEGDNQWQNVGGKLYNVDFYDTGFAQSGLHTIQYAVSTAPLMGTPPIIDWTNIATPPLNTYSYTDDWRVSFAPLVEGVTNYVSVRAWDVAGSTSVKYDVFYIKKDVTNPSIIDNQLGDDTWRKEAKPDGYAVYFEDEGGSLLNKAQWRAVRYLQSGATMYITDWIDIFTNLNQKSYYQNWNIDFDILPEGLSTIWVQVFDNAGNPQNIQTYPDPFYVKKDTTPPVCINYQSGDNTWRTTNNGLYNVDFFDATSGSGIKEVQVKVSTASEVTIVDWTTIFTTNTYSYTEDWSLPDFVWGTIPSGPQKNYISVRCIDFAYNTSTVLTNAFYIMKDTIPPRIIDNQDGDDTWRRFGGTTYNVDFEDKESSLRGAQYIVRLGPNPTDPAWSLGWVQIFSSTGAQSYTIDWQVDFANLPEGENYIFVRASDTAGLWSESTTPVFYVRKDVSAPTIIDNQDGDYTWRSTSGTLYGVFFQDTISGVTTAQYQIKDPAGNVLVDWTTIFGGTTAYKNYNSSWTISELAFNLLSEGTTNYVYVRCNDAAGNMFTLLSAAFFILKDTSPPYCVVNQDYYEYTHSDWYVDVDFFEKITEGRQPGCSKLNYAQYTIYTSTGLTGEQRKPWTNILGFTSGTTYYVDGWKIDFAALPIGTTCYVSVKVVDFAGNTSTYIDAFRVLRATPTAPIIADNQDGDYTWYNSSTTFLQQYYDVDFFVGQDTYLSTMSVIIYSNILGTGEKLVDETIVITTANVTSYTENWQLKPSTFTPDHYIWDLMHEGTNYVCVKAYDTLNSYSILYDVFFIRKDTTVPPVPVLTTPLNGTATNQLSITFSWQASKDLTSGTSSYTIHVSIDPNFGVVNYSSTTNLQYVILNLQSENTYYWRVNAKDYAGNVSGWSEVFKLWVDTTPPSVSNPVSPSNGTISNSLSQTFLWTTATDNFSGVKNYTLQISTDPVFGVINYSSTTQAESCGYQLVQSTYYWRIQTED